MAGEVAAAERYLAPFRTKVPLLCPGLFGASFKGIGPLRN
jgi:hypothetical protein